MKKKLERTLQNCSKFSKRSLKERNLAFLEVANFANQFIQTSLEESILLNWEESEIGWGVRPDGCSLHRNMDDVEKYVKEYWNEMPEKTPDEYSRPAGKPIKAYVSERIYQKIKKSKNGIRFYEIDMRNDIKNKEIIL